MVEPGHTITELARQLSSRAIRSVDITERCLDRIAKRDGTINAFTHVAPHSALEHAARADAEIASGLYRGALHGVPLCVKDLIDVEGLPTTAASRVRGGRKPAPTDAAVVATLRQAGAIFLGKTNLHEFALGTTNEDSAFGPVRHPLDLTRSPGGSSGGSAAAVLDGMAYASVGTDTGGSIRIPAAACGLVGLKPSLGDLSTEGVFPLSASLDHVGPICRSVADAVLMYHGMRSTPVELHEPATIRGLRVGILGGYFQDKIDPDVSARFDEACERLRRADVVLDTISIPHAETIGAVYLLISLPEAAAVHARTLDVAPGNYTPAVRSRLEAARYLLAEDVARARRGQDILRREVDAALEGRDALLLPSLPIPAPIIGISTVSVGGSDEPTRTMTLRHTQLFNLTGHPAVSMPCGVTTRSLPVGAQLVGPIGRTPTLLGLAAMLEPHLAASCP